MRALEKEGLPVAFITTMTMVAKQLGANRVISGHKIPHPCGDPGLPAEADHALRHALVQCALDALQRDVSSPTIFTPNADHTS